MGNSRTELYNEVTLLAQENQVLEASIAERDKMIVELTIKMNKLAEKLEAVLAEKVELEKKIEMMNASP